MSFPCKRVASATLFYVHTLKGAPFHEHAPLLCAKAMRSLPVASLPYEKQLERKQNEMIELFEPFAGEGTVFNPIAGMDEPYYYRNKVTSPYVPGRKTKGGKKPRGKKGNAGAKSAPQHEILCGMYAAGTHRVINTDSCLLENKDAKQAFWLFGRSCSATTWSPTTKTPTQASFVTPLYA